jgi:hypothetical protein
LKLKTQARNKLSTVKNRVYSSKRIEGVFLNFALTRENFLFPKEFISNNFEIIFRKKKQKTKRDRSKIFYKVSFLFYCLAMPRGLDFGTALYLRGFLEEKNYSDPNKDYLLSIRPRPLFLTVPAAFNSLEITSKIPLINWRLLGVL